MNTLISGPVRILVVAMLCLAGAAPTGVSAQEENREEKKVTVEVKDGKVFVNGEEKAFPEDGRLTFEDEDGEEVTVIVRRGRGGRTMVWTGDADDSSTPEGTFFFRGPDEEFELMVPPMAGRMNEMMRMRERAFDPEGLHGELAVDAEELQARIADEVRGRAMWMGDGPAGFMFMDDELRTLERQIRELSGRLRRAEEADRAGIESELDRKLGEAFDHKQAADRRQAERLEEQLDQLRSRLTERDASRADVIARRKRQLLGERDSLDW